MQASPLDEFHHDEGSLFHLARVVDRDNIGVIELGDGFGFPQQPRAPLSLHFVPGDELDRYLPFKRRIKCAVDCAHTSMAKFIFEAIAIVEQRLAHKLISSKWIRKLTSELGQWRKYKTQQLEIRVTPRLGLLESKMNYNAALHGKSEPMPTDDRLSFSLKNQLSKIQRFQDTFAQFAIEHDLKTPTIRELHVVFDELLSNIVRYAYLDEKTHEFEVEIDVSTERLMITIVDYGIPFDPLEADTPDTSLPLQERTIGGLGIHLVQNMVDEFTYERDGDRNIVVLVKSL